MEYLTHVTVMAAGAVLLIQQILKSKIVPLDFANKHPVPTNILLSIIAAVVLVWKTTLQPHAWTDWVQLVGTISLVAAVTYNQLIGKSHEVKSTEG